MVAKRKAFGRLTRKFLLDLKGKLSYLRGLKSSMVVKYQGYIRGGCTSARAVCTRDRMAGFSVLAFKNFLAMAGMVWVYHHSAELDGLP